MLKVCIVFAVVALFLTTLSESKKPVGCFNKDELMDHAEHFIMKYLHLSHGHMVQSLDDPNPRTALSCSNFILQTSSTEYHNRSVSPWRHRIDHDEERYPSKIAVAECLCEGCIINGKEDMSYNSVPVKRSQLVLKRVECPIKPHLYSFAVSTIKVPVACTCLRPISSQ
ncbi:interleukin-17C [Conger conger]|uniref:interleukin-17C n=1 Tax=Conger conger TaxID=82655 RepID=UPI002A5A1C11|nr:interleukin-17C [Conger conger]